MIRSNENQTNRIGSKVTIAFTTPSLYDPVKTALSESKAEDKTSNKARFRAL